MSKKTWRNDIRVEVSPKFRSWGSTEDNQIRDCENMIEQIERHVDDVCGCRVVWDTAYTCSYCGYGWDEDRETGAPLCCNDAIEEWQNKEDTP